MTMNASIETPSAFRTLDPGDDARRGLLERLRFVESLLREAGPACDAGGLLFRDPQGKVCRQPVDASLVVGRGERAGLRVADNRMSGAHFRLRREPERVVLEDLQSRNETWVNGERVTERELRDGDVIEAGSQVFVFLGAL